MTIIIPVIGIGLIFGGGAWVLMLFGFSYKQIRHHHFWLRLLWASFIILCGYGMQKSPELAQARQHAGYQQDTKLSHQITKQMVDLQTTQFKLHRLSHNNNKVLATIGLREHESKLTEQIKHNINQLTSNAKILVYGHQFDKIMGRQYEDYNWNTHVFQNWYN